MTVSDITGSNSLADLAARIRAEHEATGEALRSSVAHGIAAGELLLEAKAQMPHGQWLPWLKDNCAMSERTAQLYMRLAKNRAVIEIQIRNHVADLTLNEAAALLMLSADVRKLLNFMKECEDLSGEEFIERCIAEGFPVIHDPGYDPLAGRNEVEAVEWHLFIGFLSFDEERGQAGGEPAHVTNHVEWILQRPFHNVAQWLGDEGEKFRAQWGMHEPSDEFKSNWAAFLAERRTLTLAEVQETLDTLQRRFEEARAKGVISTPSLRRKRRRSRETERQRGQHHDT
jgi:hypothetical protein